MDAVDKVAGELKLYSHPFFEWSAEERAGGVEVLVRSTVAGVHTPEYRFALTERDIDDSQFRWNFQKLLYGNLNDYMVELFTGSPYD
jgi:hypothetical protein